MKTSGNTVLVTGGSAGIGFEIARSFVQKGNHVVITGRNKERLDKAVAKLQQATGIVSDVSNEKDVELLVSNIEKNFPNLNVVINNAGYASYYKLDANAGAYEKASNEMLTNYLSIIRLNEKLLTLLSKQKDATIVNVSSIVAFSPSHRLSTYAASKAALHSYTQSLRFALRATGIKVFELMPPLVNTEFSQEIGGENGIPPSQVSYELFEALENDDYEIHVGQTADLYRLFLSSPAEAFKTMNAVE
ncbi:SDR family oxidoreductase [Pinibacter soli]|uniref:SDR family NAD(P)-dependent oxidoreductase n=1 Tax=Pinibacter soli TaxID=3044211 RepID=A0ABT6RDA6_9BACT|nr:SDR family NAD(P)-dependent oxidoreductase [Pinibacter soli]MDI3320546.1 SDR family NAD(P)-dependent oxidoreductase [Pinibacter soli]